MPKIIKNVREQLLQEAARQVATQGYAATTMRSVASACGLAVGTVYNYFPSKDMLIATFMAEDWTQCLAEIDDAAARDAQAMLLTACEVLRRFADRHRALFCDKAAARIFSTVFSERHRQLCNQLSARILPHCVGKTETERRLAAELAAEGLLTFAMRGTPIEELLAVLIRLLEN